MTKARAALTFAQAITRIAGQIGWDAAAEITGRSTRTVRLWSEPDHDGTPTLAQAIALDTAFAAAGGEGAPLLDCYALQLGVQIAAATACHQALAVDVATAARECGDAISMTIAVIRPGASPTEIHRAIGETEDGVGAMTAMLRRLKSFLPVGAGPGARKSGGAR